MGPFEMVVAIVLIVTIGRIIINHREAPDAIENWDDDDEVTVREFKKLHAELKSMKDRVAVLERIATDHDKTIALDREIEALRDR